MPPSRPPGPGQRLPLRPGPARSLSRSRECIRPGPDAQRKDLHLKEEIPVKFGFERLECRGCLQHFSAAPGTQIYLQPLSLQEKIESEAPLVVFVGAPTIRGQAALRGSCTEDAADSILMDGLLHHVFICFKIFILIGFWTLWDPSEEPTSSPGRSLGRLWNSLETGFYAD